MRVRLRCASARGFRGRAFGRFEDIWKFTFNRRQSPLIIFYGDIPLIGLMAYSFARVGVVIRMKVGSWEQRNLEQR